MFFKKIKRKKYVDFLLKFFLFFATFLTFSIFISIIIYVFINGFKFLNFNFIFSQYSEINPTKKGLLPSMINTLYVIFITLSLVIAPGVGTAVYLNQYAKNNMFTRIIRISTDVLAGIPSIIFGLFGASVFCNFFGLGVSIISGCLTMAVCSLPIIIKTSEEALNTVPKNIIKGSQALGASKLKTIFSIILPASSSGILTGIALTISRVLGESSALVFTCGLGYHMPTSFFSHITKSGRTLTLHLFRTAKQAATSDAFSQSFATASTLLILIFFLNLILDFIKKIINKK